MKVEIPTYAINRNSIAESNQSVYLNFYTENGDFVIINNSLNSLDVLNGFDVVCSVNMNGKIVTFLNEIAIQLNKKYNIIKIQTGNSNTTIAIQEYEYIIKEFDSSQPILTSVNVDARFDLWGTLILTPFRITSA